MTYSNSRPHNIASKTAASPEDHEAGYPSMFQRLVGAALVLMTRFARARGPKTRNALVLVLTLLLILHGGTREEKKAFLKRLVARHLETQERLRARYRIWRQRKCWMWGGGYYAGVLSDSTAVMRAACDRHSFDALIPD